MAMNHKLKHVLAVNHDFSLFN